MRQSKDVYQLVTDHIVHALEQGQIPWRKTWKQIGPARNYVTGHVYSGVNTIITNLSPNEYPLFMTLKQANTLGGKVKRGAKSLPIVYWNILHKTKDGQTVSEDDAERMGSAKRFFLRYYRVFNIADIEGIEITLPEFEEHDPIKRCEEIVLGYPSPPPAIEYRGDQAFYAPPIDMVRMPPRKLFESAEAFYATLFHELLHSTGNSTRLKREGVMGKVKFGSVEYSQEELVAELGAAFLCQIAGIANEATLTNTTSYIQGWLSKLKDDKKMIFRAAKEARAAVEYLLG